MKFKKINSLFLLLLLLFNISGIFCNAQSNILQVEDPCLDIFTQKNNSNTENLNDIFKKTLKLVKECGEILKNVNVDKEVSVKSSEGDLVTKYDFLIDKKLTKGLKTIIRCSVLSEEHEECKENNTYFIIDPIDGTYNFSFGWEIFGIIVAFVKEETTLFSIVHFPLLDKTFTAIKGEGAYLNGKRISVKNNSFNKLIGSCLLIKSNLDNINAILKCEKNVHVDLRCTGCVAYDFAQIANGVCDFVFFENAGGPWDFIGPKLIIEEAGGTLEFKKCDKGYSVIAGTKEAVNIIKNLVKVL